MSLRIIYGKSGAGKSSYIFHEIAKKIENKSDHLLKKVYIITPEQFSFTAEKKLMDSLSTNAVIDAEVLTFGRMAYRVVNQTRRANSQNLSSSGKSMLLYHILSEKKNDFTFIGKSAENVELIDRQITEFKKHTITPDAVKNVLEQTQDKYLKAKLQDMLQIYQQYQEELESTYIDENDILTILAQKLENVQDFKDCDIYIDEFVGFTKQEYEIIRILLRNNNHIHITVCTDSIDKSINPDTDIFYTNKQTLDKIFQIAKEEKIKIEEPVNLQYLHRFTNRELLHMEQYLYAVPYKKYDYEVENIPLFLAKNPYSEIEHVGQEIIKLVRDKGYRYQDISIITKNLDGYTSLCKAIFQQYHIPVFIDEKKDLSQNILVRYLLAILNIFAKNWSYEAMFEYIKTGFLEVDSMDIPLLENYCLRWGIRGSKWYKEEWNFYEETEEEKEKILHIKDLIIMPLLKLRQEFIGQKDVKTITQKLYEFLIENRINQKLEEKIEKLNKSGQIEKAKEYETSWKVIMDLLDEIITLLGNKKVSFEKYAEILKIGLGNSGLGKIPATQDGVIVGDVDRSRSHKVKAVFIIGLNDGAFPSVNKNEGFFNDTDRETLKSTAVELAKGTLEKLYDDNFNIYKAFSTAEEKLFLSYVSADLEGKSLRPSMLVNRIKKIFPNIREESDVIEKQNQIITQATSFEALLDKLRAFKEEGHWDEKENPNMWFALYEYYKTNEKWKARLENSMQAIQDIKKPENIQKEWIDKLYGNTLKTSVSRLEQYKACPFSYYLKYGLKLNDKNEFKIQAIDTGTFMHDIIDAFFEEIENGEISIKQLEEEQINRLVNEIIEEKLQLKKNYIFTSIPKYRVLANRLKKVVQKSMQYIVESLKYSKFEVMGHEVEFKQGKEYPPIEVMLEDGRKVEITGKIDRMDIAKTAQGDYIRIIDYKSSVKDINLNEVVAGLQLQLLTYLDAVCEKDSFLPAGVLYFNLIDPVIKANSNMTEEQIKEEIRKQFKMKGLILADIDIVKMMDTALEKGNSNRIPAYIDKDGNVSMKQSTINRKQFESLQKYTKKIIKQISKEILDGNIDIKPYYKIKNASTPCQYCSYQSICNFNSGICKHTYQYIGNKNKDEILESMK